MVQALDIPLRLRKRPRSARGYPIPFVALMRDDVPDFRTLDAGRVYECIVQRICALCGRSLGRQIYFIGGPASVANGLFSDPAMHFECALFALKTCPFLSRADMGYSTKPLRPVEGSDVVTDEHVATDRRPTALMRTSGYNFVVQYISAWLPWQSVTWYKDGRPIPEPEDLSKWQTSSLPSPSPSL